jgi:N-acetylneuraminate synthase
MKLNFLNIARPLLIAEVAQAHDGSLGMAHAFIDAAAESGADAIKFQTHIASAESTLDEPFRVNFSRQDDTRHGYWKRMEFTAEQWRGLADHAREKNLHFLSSPFSVEAVELLKDLGMPAWKIGSGEGLSRELLDAVIVAGGPVMLSTGMSKWSEIDDVVRHLSAAQAEFVLMQCTSKYPTPLNEVGLNVLDEMKKRYGCPVGISDHSGTIYPALAAMARGCAAVEVHVIFDKRMFGPDVSASITFAELALISGTRDAFAAMDSKPVDKDTVAESMATMRATFGKSLATRSTLKAGTLLTRELITFKKPATGISANLIEQVIGKRLVKDVTPDRLLHWEDMND